MDEDEVPEAGSDGAPLLNHPHVVRRDVALRSGLERRRGALPPPHPVLSATPAPAAPPPAPSAR